MLGRCSHEFSWPRRGSDGEYYQVCMLCAAEYKYDWATMRRTQRLEHAKPENHGTAQSYAGETSVLDAPRPPFEARYGAPLPCEQHQHLV